MLLSEIPETDRPREKLAARGAAALTDAELLAIFLRTGRKGKSVLALATELIAVKGSLHALSRCDAHELAASVSGIGRAKAAELCAAVELGKRLARGGTERPVVDAAQAAFELFGPSLQALDHEVLRVLLLDTKLRLLREEEIAAGSLNECVAHPRELFKMAIIHRAYAVIVMHNHPSGDPAPSRADQTLTSRLREGASFLQINLLDHIIVGTAEGGRQPYFSFREAGLL